jgi:hypothetical protein
MRQHQPPAHEDVTRAPTTWHALREVLAKWWREALATAAPYGAGLTLPSSRESCG